MCRYCAFSVKTKHPVLTRPILNPQNPFSAPKFWSPGLAAELCGRAPPNSVLLSGGPTGVAEAARLRFELRETEEKVLVDGAPTALFELLDARSTAAQQQQQQQQQGAAAAATALLGRDAETRRLLQLFETSLRESRPSLCLLTGHAGTGKSAVRSCPSCPPCSLLLNNHTSTPRGVAPPLAIRYPPLEWHANPYNPSLCDPIPFLCQRTIRPPLRALLHPPRASTPLALR